MLTKGAIGNLINRYRAVLKKCHLINTFGSLAVASMLVLGGAGVAGATPYTGSLTSVSAIMQDIEISDAMFDGTSVTGNAVSVFACSVKLTGNNSFKNYSSPAFQMGGGSSLEVEGQNIFQGNEGIWGGPLTLNGLVVAPLPSAERIRFRRTLPLRRAVLLTLVRQRLRL